MSEASERRVEAGLLSVASIAVLAAACAACGIVPGWKKTPVVPPVVVSPPVKEDVQVSAVPAFRLVVPATHDGSTSRLLVVNALVKNVGAVPLEFRPEAARLLLPDGSGGMVFDPPRAQELLRRTIPVSLDAPPADAASERSRLAEIRYALLNGVSLEPGQQAHGYLVADMRAPVASLEGIVLEVAATRQSDQTVTRSSYAFVSRSAAPGAGEN
jgi:hypothetical protein